MGERGIAHTDLPSTGFPVPKLLRKWDISVDEVTLVPGGRFAITRTAEEGAESGKACPEIIALWDLGLPGSTTPQAPACNVANYAVPSEIVSRALGRGFKVFVPAESVIRVVFSYSLPSKYIR